jgi:hypothetical protein
MDVKLGLFTLTLFKNRVLRKISGAERRQVPGESEKLHDVEPSVFVTRYSDDQIKNEMGRTCGKYVVQTCIRGLLGKHEGKRHFSRSGW